MLRQPGTIIETEKGNFTVIREIGRGAFGCAYAVNYFGNDQDIIALSPSNSPPYRMALKELLNPDEKNVKEFKHEAALNKKLQYSKNKKDRPCLAGVSLLNVENKSDVIVSQLVTYGENESNSLSGFLQKMWESGVNPNETDNPIFQAFSDDNLAITLAQIVCAMHNDLNFFHAKDIIHLDIASRNFLVSPIMSSDGLLVNFHLVLCDYGMAIDLLKQGVVYDATRTSGPLKWMSSHRLLDYANSVFSDSYSFRVSVIDMIGMLFGRGEGDSIRIENDKPSTSADVARCVTAWGEDAVLACYFENMNKFVGEGDSLRAADKNKTQPVQLFLNSFQEFLTNMPVLSVNNNNEAEAACKKEDALLKKSLALFKENITTFFEKKYVDGIPQKILQRLEALQVNEFKVKPELAPKPSGLGMFAAPNNGAVNSEVALSKQVPALPPKKLK